MIEQFRSIYDSFAVTLTFSCVSTEAPLEGENEHQSTAPPLTEASQFPVALIATFAVPPEDGNTRLTFVSDDQLTSTEALPEEPVSGNVRSGGIGVQEKDAKVSIAKTETQQDILFISV